MSILITGAAGFIGSHLTDRLLREGRDVVCIDNFCDYYPPRIKRANIASALAHNPPARLYEGDICDVEFCAGVFQQERIDCVVHLAARAGVRPSLQNPALYATVNCVGLVNLLELARRHSVQKFVFASSSSVYGNNKKVPFSESDPVNEPISPYAATKRAGELLCRTYHHLYGLPTVCLRLFTVYGPRQRPDMAIHKFTRLIDEGKPIQVFGDGTTKRDYTFCDDIVDGIVAAIDADLKFEIINLGDSKVVELRYLVQLIETALGKRACVQNLPEQPGDVRITFADIAKARALLGYEPKVPIEQGIEIFVQWFRQARPLLSG